MLNTYEETLEYLYTNLPMFQRVGAAAYKKDLSNTIQLCEVLNNPQNSFKSIHVAGTNGKGSTSHMIASVLQTAGYKTGLYTSPHLKEFTERIKINGVEINKDYVVDFVNRIQPTIETIKPSFFEITVAMAFDYFRASKIDVAVIEVGLGGRLDSTNVINPVLSVITNIGFDHKDLLGDTLQKIAAEKAGIIKYKAPVIISERQPEVEQVFLEKAKQEEAPIQFATDRYEVFATSEIFNVFKDKEPFINNLSLPLKGNYQAKNLSGVFLAIETLNALGFSISYSIAINGLENVVKLTGLKGRWQKLSDNPLMICDTGHNEDGIREVVNQMLSIKCQAIHIVWGMVKDKDVDTVLSMLPKRANYYFCQASIPRAMDAYQLQELAAKHQLSGVVIRSVNEAIKKAKQSASPDDFIFIGGSTFVVAEIENL